MEGSCELAGSGREIRKLYIQTMEKSGKSFKKMSILSSLNPLFVCAQISGIPAYSEPRNKSCFIRIFGYFSFMLTLISLSINCFFQVYNFFEAIQLRFVCGSLNYAYTNLPLQMAELFQIFIRPLFVAGVPLIFTFQFYFTGRFQKIWSSIEEIEKKLVLPNSFYRKFRKVCLFLIAIALLVIVFNVNSI